ncbi:MAG: Wzz/FepE/Etk N-terminal domain-containing protein, partial [Gammaproteobacteria bacterium]
MAEITEYYDRRQNKQNSDDDEISLLDLYLVLKRRKNAIVLTLALVLVLAVAYVLWAPKVYQTHVMIFPAARSDMQLTNMDVGRSPVDVGMLSRLDPKDVLEAINSRRDAGVSTRFEPKEVFEAAKSRLKSRQTWDAFVKKQPALFSQPATGEGESADNPLNFTQAKDFPGEHVLIKYDLAERENGADILDQYLAFAAGAYVADLQRDEQAALQRRMDALQRDIDTSRQAARAEIHDEVTRLEHNLAIARQLGIADNQLMTIKNAQSLTVITSDLKVRDYMRGVKVLSAELAQLKQRQADDANIDAYVDGFRYKQLALQRLQSIEFLPEQFQPFRVDGQAAPPVKIKPRARMVLALAIVLGLMLGIFAAFLLEFFHKA